MREQEPTVSVRDLAVDLGGRPVLRDVDLTFRSGELVAMLGPNGAGKTTLLRALLGLVPLRGGEVRLAGLAPKQSWRAVGYVPQRHEFAWEFPVSVEQVVMTGLTRHIGPLRWPSATHHKAVRRALVRVQMDHLARRPVGQLSGGQRQRVLIARALAADPRVLLLDEPFTGVDVPTQELLVELLRGATEEGTTVVMTTHDLAQALEISDRVCLINRTVVADAPPSKVKADPGWAQAWSRPVEQWDGQLVDRELEAEAC